jgi:hypothetical protein
MHHQRLRDWNAVPRQQFSQIDLVVAAEDRVRIINYYQPLGRGTSREAIGVVFDEGVVTNEQAVETTQPPKIRTANDFGLNVQ